MRCPHSHCFETDLRGAGHPPYPFLPVFIILLSLSLLPVSIYRTPRSASDVIHCARLHPCGLTVIWSVACRFHLQTLFITPVKEVHDIEFLWLLPPVDPVDDYKSSPHS